MKNTHSSSKRLESLDALRGFDLFFLVALGPLMHSLARTANMEWLNESMWVFSHVSWEGFSPWDLIMPLFLFMSGISMRFLCRAINPYPTSDLYCDGWQNVYCCCGYSV